MATGLFSLSYSISPASISGSSPNHLTHIVRVKVISIVIYFLFKYVNGFVIQAACIVLHCLCICMEAMHILACDDPISNIIKNFEENHLKRNFECCIKVADAPDLRH